MITKEVWGRWLSRDEDDPRVQVVDLRVGKLMTRSPLGKVVFGSPHDFEADSGLRGAELMEHIFPAPTVDQLLHGCLRETLANGASAARIGRQETRDFDGPGMYIADNNEGDLVCVTFSGDECFGAGYSHDPFREFDYETALPTDPDLRGRAQRIACLPLFGSSTQPFTAVFWSSEGRVLSSDPWYITHTFLSDILDNEISSDSAWLRLAEEHYELPAPLLHAVVDIVSRVDAKGILKVRSVERQLLFPTEKQNSQMVIEELVAGGCVVLQD